MSVFRSFIVHIFAQVLNIEMKVFFQQWLFYAQFDSKRASQKGG
jgi:hypothetical protein